VVSVNANRGVHRGYRAGDADQFFILPRGNLVLRHLQKLKEWNDCTVSPSCQTPASLGFDLRSKLDFGNVGLFGHSRGGQGVRAAHSLYRESGSPWPGRIAGLSVKGIFEVGPTDFITRRGFAGDIIESKFVGDGTNWNILLPMCDSDVFELSGMNAYDRMLLSNVDSPAAQKSTFLVHGANHNFYNTVWNFHDKNLDKFGDFRCLDHDALFQRFDTGSADQRETAISAVLAFFRANVGTSSNPNYNRTFNPEYEIPAGVQELTRFERGFTPSPSSAFTTSFEDFSNSINGDNCSSGSNTCTVGGAPNVSPIITNITPYHDTSLKVLNVNWTSPGNDKYLQINWRPTGVGADVSTNQTFDFRISRLPAAPNVHGATNFSIQLVMADGALSNAVKLCNYAYVDGPVGGFDPVYNPSNEVIGATAKYRPILQTVRIPLAAFAGANLSLIRGIRITFNESSVGSVFLANFRFTK
jgi:hypothetical protein